MDFYAGNMSLLNDIAQIETDAGPSGSEAAPALPDPKDTHRSTQAQMALFEASLRVNCCKKDHYISALRSNSPLPPLRRLPTGRSFRRFRPSRRCRR